MESLSCSFYDLGFFFPRRTEFVCWVFGDEGCVTFSSFFFWQLGPGRMDSVYGDVWRWNPDTRSDLQARDICHVDDESQRGRLPRRRPLGAQGAQLQPGPLRQMAHLRLGESKKK